MKWILIASDVVSSERVCLRSSSAMTERVGQQLGNYHLIRLLGDGGFAGVYLGAHIPLNTAAAIKVLHPRRTSGEIAQFRNGARSIARLEHPHTLRDPEFGLEERIPFLVM